MTEQVEDMTVEDTTVEKSTAVKPSRKPRGNKPPKPKTNKDGLVVGEQVDFETIKKLEREQRSKNTPK